MESTIKQMKFDIEDYTFESFEKSLAKEGEVKNYIIGELKEHRVKVEEKLKVLGKKEKNIAKDQLFRISPIVKKFRGIKDIEDGEFRANVKEEANLQVEEIKDEAYRKAYERGYSEGRNQALEEEREKATFRLDGLAEMIEELSTTQAEILKEQQSEVYHLVKSLSKWVILRELYCDGDYVVRLLEKLISELQLKENLIIYINKSRYEEMPTILNMLEERLGILRNVRVEFLDDEDERGLVLESENGILNGTLKDQLDNLDKLFETIGLSEDEGVDISDDNSILPPLDPEVLYLRKSKQEIEKEREEAKKRKLEEEEELRRQKELEEYERDLDRALGESESNDQDKVVENKKVEEDKKIEEDIKAEAPKADENQAPREDSNENDKSINDEPQE